MLEASTIKFKNSNRTSISTRASARVGAIETGARPCRTKMKKYIDDLARFSMIEKVEIAYEKINLEEIFAKALDTLSSEIRKSDVKITIESPHTLISGWQ